MAAQASSPSCKSLLLITKAIVNNTQLKGQLLILNYSPTEIHGVIRGRPDIQVRPLQINLKITSKLFLMPKEEVERVLLSNLNFNGSKKALILDVTKAIDMMRDYDINHMKPKFSEIKCKLIIPDFMLEQDIHEEFKAEEEQEGNFDDARDIIIIDITIR